VSGARKDSIMSHPKNKRERFLVGVKKSKLRVMNFLSYREKDKHPELILKWERRHRNTSKTCSCMMCGNPRKFYNQKTIQEIRFEQKERLN
jgi:hypothetical protein